MAEWLVIAVLTECQFCLNEAKKVLGCDGICKYFPTIIIVNEDFHYSLMLCKCGVYCGHSVVVVVVLTFVAG